MEPIIVHLTPSSPNQYKVILLLEELSLPYTTKNLQFSEVKSEPFISINPNGRVPAIEDPNTGITLWESGAILLYLVEQYDTGKRLTYTDFKERQLLNQWLLFQCSGQGPYFGQAGWFNFGHHEKLPSAIERYNNEIQRVLSVLEKFLTGREWLVGEKCTFVDIAFAPYNARAWELMGKSPEENLSGYPNVKAWHGRVTGRESWPKAMQLRDRSMDEQGLSASGLPKGFKNVQEYQKYLEDQKK